MNKPAAKEPSMDEILSSIRQIIADDDAAAAPRRPAIQAAPPPMQAAPAKPLGDQADRDLSDMLDDIEPLALSPSQIVDDNSDAGGFSFESILADTAEDDAPSLVEAEDVAFETDDDLPSFDPLPTRALEQEAAPEPEPDFMALAAAEPEVAAAPEPIRRPEPVAAPEPVMAQASPLPDPTLTSDMTEELLEPATRAAVRSSIGKLNALGIGNPGLTIEAMMRDMLRPMLKEWLDENLPAVVERMVEKELSRISRGE
jgi:cell pole-organizing protein PopZ